MEKYTKDDVLKYAKEHGIPENRILLDRIQTDSNGFIDKWSFHLICADLLRARNEVRQWGKIIKHMKEERDSKASGKDEEIMEKKQRPQDKWNAANGLVSVSYKLRKEIADQFAEACKKADTSKKKQLEKMMLEFIEETKKEGQ